ncbi:MAG: DUF3179 domain-containing protein [Chloroflexi bacterium]|nr:DUF3179 domain-containing protein [Chloroflexota bacterium]
MPMTRLPTGLLMIVTALIVAACAPAPPPPEPALPLLPTIEDDEEKDARIEAALEGEGPLTDQQAIDLMYILSDESITVAQRATDRIVAAEDERFIAVYIELMRGDEIVITGFRSPNSRVPPLQALSGQEFGPNWAEWLTWYGGTELAPPPGFLTWKGRLLGRIDSGFRTFIADDRAASEDLRPEEIVWGGVRVDGIPSLDDPAHLLPDEAEYITPDEPVFGLFINGEARAYPLRIMDWHEMSNDTIGGVPIALAYCTLCGSAIAYDRRASDGNTYTFGSSGLLYRSNKLMYDRETNTLWNHLTGEPVLGPLVGTGVEMDIWPVVLTSWAEWLERHPDTLVLNRDTGFSRPYELGAAYAGYFSFEGIWFPVAQRNSILEDKDQIFVLRADESPKAYPLETLRDEQVVNDEVGGVEVVLVAARPEILVDGVSQRSGPATYSAGSEVRAYARDGRSFSLGDDPDTLIDENGDAWQVTDSALVGPDGTELERQSGHLAYWFGFFAFFPTAPVYGFE